MWKFIPGSRRFEHAKTHGVFTKPNMPSCLACSRATSSRVPGPHHLWPSRLLVCWPGLSLNTPRGVVCFMNGTRQVIWHVTLVLRPGQPSSSILHPSSFTHSMSRSRGKGWFPIESGLYKVPFVQICGGSLPLRYPSNSIRVVVFFVAYWLG